jgi:hypothetical protein
MDVEKLNTINRELLKRKNFKRDWIKFPFMASFEGGRSLFKLGE